MQNLTKKEFTKEEIAVSLLVGFLCGVVLVPFSVMLFAMFGLHAIFKPYDTDILGEIIESSMWVFAFPFAFYKTMFDELFIAKA